MTEYYGEGSVAVSPTSVPAGTQMHPNNADPYKKLVFTYTVGAHGLPANKGAGIRIFGWTRSSNPVRQQTLCSLSNATKVTLSATVESPPGTPYTTGFTCDGGDNGKMINVLLTTQALNAGDLIKVEVTSASNASSEEGFFFSASATNLWVKGALKWNVYSRTADPAHGGWLWPNVPLSDRQQTGACPNSGTSTTILFDANASSSNDFYNGWVVWLTGGKGIGQKQVVSDYNGSTREATVSAWDTGQIPDATTTYDLKGWAETKIIANAPTKIRTSISALHQGSDVVWSDTDNKTEEFDVLVSVLDNWGNIDEDYAGTITLTAKKSDNSACSSEGISTLVFDGSEGGYKEVTRVWLTEQPSDGFAWIEATASGLSQVEARPILVWATAPPYHEVFGDPHNHTRTDHSNFYGEPQGGLEYQRCACQNDWRSLGDHSLGGSAQELLPYWDAEYVTEQAKHPGLSSQEASCQEGDQPYDDGTYMHELFYEGRSGDFVLGSLIAGGTSAARAIIAWAEDNRDSNGDRLTRGQLLLIDLTGHFRTGETITEQRTGGAHAKVTTIAWDVQYFNPPFAVGNTVTGATSGATGTVRWIGSAGKRMRLDSVSGVFISAEDLRVGGTAKAVYMQGDANNSGGAEGDYYKHVCILQGNDRAVNMNPNDGRSDQDVAADINHRLCRDIVLSKGRNGLGSKHLHSRIWANFAEGGRIWVDNSFYPLLEVMSDVTQFMGPQFAVHNDGRPDTGDDWGLFRYGCYWAWRYGFRVGFTGGSDNHNNHPGSLWWHGHMGDVHAQRVGDTDVAGLPDWPDEAGITGVLLPWDATAYSDGDMMDAMRARRTVAMSGHKSKLACKLTLDGVDYPPGSIIRSSGTKALAFNIQLMSALPELNISSVKVVRYQLKPSVNIGYAATDILSATPAAKAYVNTTLTDSITLGTGDNTLWVYYVWFQLNRWPDQNYVPGGTYAQLMDFPQHWGISSPWYLEYVA